MGIKAQNKYYQSILWYCQYFIQSHSFIEHNNKINMNADSIPFFLDSKLNTNSYITRRLPKKQIIKEIHWNPYNLINLCFHITYLISFFYHFAPFCTPHYEYIPIPL